MAIAEVGAGSQRNTNNNSSAPSVDIAFPGNVTAGNLIIVSGGIWNASTLSSITGSTKVGSTATVASYTTIFGATGVAWGGGVGTPYIIYGLVSGGGPLTVTVTPNLGSSYLNVACNEFSGVNATPLDVNGGEQTFGSAMSATDTITTVTANDLLVGSIALSGAVGAITPGSSYTQFGSDVSALFQPYSTEFVILVSAPATHNVDWSWTVSAQSSSVVNAAFKETAAAGDPLIGAFMMA